MTSKAPTKVKPLARRKPGRPSKYNLDLAVKICQAIATNTGSMQEIIDANEGLPLRKTIADWRWNHHEFSHMYADAKRHQAELMAEELVEDSVKAKTYTDGDGNERVDGGSIQSQRLIVDTKKWIACKLAPKIYADQRHVEKLIEQTQTMKDELRELRIALAEKNKREY